MAESFNFIITTDDLIIKFSCLNHKKRVDEIMRNLRIDGSDQASVQKKLCRYATPYSVANFSFGGEKVEGNSFEYEAVFFENTDYPLIVKGNDKKLKHIELYIADHLRSDTDKKDTIQSDSGELYGSLNFHNQVGQTDFKFVYTLNGGEKKSFSFSTEVLSYKLDYRNDLKTIITDIEREYAMLSYSFLKDTYLSFRTKAGQSTELIWWQIFKSCYDDILKATRIIIDRPKRRLRGITRFERAERLPYLSQDAEREYEAHKNNPAYLYRYDDMVLSHDTIENRFLKYALRSMLQKFTTIASHIQTALHLTDSKQIGCDMETMESELKRAVNHPFFRGVGTFKGFSQESLVMKQALGYKEIFQHWVTLQQGYELEEGMRKLEVKDISDLYEIWCFIKVKNIVSEVLAQKKIETTAQSKGKAISSDFIPKLIYGGSVQFVKDGGVELASVYYNAEIEKKEFKSIDGIRTLTTIQRPDIMLRLTKEGDDMLYTYLFDAKYRINDTQMGGHDVPPPDAIDQIHRYRDAIYYSADNDKLKKEIIAGYVLFPGNVPDDAMSSGAYYYERSNRKIGIGAFPLRPDAEQRNEQGELIVNPNNSEQALKRQIEEWLSDKDARNTLLHNSIPQKGLEYKSTTGTNGVLMVMMEKYETKVQSFANGKIAIGLKLTEESMTILENLQEIGYILFHKRKDDDQHLFALTTPCSVVKADSEQLAGVYQNISTASRYLIVEFNHSAELDSTSLHSSKAPWIKKTRYDAQYSLLTNIR